MTAKPPNAWHGTGTYPSGPLVNSTIRHWSRSGSNGFGVIIGRCPSGKIGSSLSAGAANGFIGAFRGTKLDGQKNPQKMGVRSVHSQALATSQLCPVQKPAGSITICTISPTFPAHRRCACCVGCCCCCCFSGGRERESLPGRYSEWGAGDKFSFFRQTPRFGRLVILERVGGRLDGKAKVAGRLEAHAAARRPGLGGHIRGLSLGTAVPPTSECNGSHRPTPPGGREGNTTHMTVGEHVRHDDTRNAPFSRNR